MIRSLSFRAAYWALSIFFALTALPLLALPGRKAVMGWIQLYTRLMVAAMRHVGGIKVQVTGVEHLPKGPAIIAAKHQSWGDGFVVFSQVKDLAFVTGDHLLNFPLLGPILRKMGAIVVDNCGGAASRMSLLGDLDSGAQADRSILIYPEGHLSPVGTKHRYRKGVWHMAQATGLPVVPVATDLGLRWPEQSSRLRPGPCTVAFLPPLERDLGKEAFMATLEERIETASFRLLEAQAAAGTLPKGVALPTGPEAITALPPQNTQAAA